MGQNIFQLIVGQYLIDKILPLRTYELVSLAKLLERLSFYLFLFLSWLVLSWFKGEVARLFLLFLLPFVPNGQWYFFVGLALHLTQVVKSPIESVLLKQLFSSIDLAYSTYGFIGQVIM